MKQLDRASLERYNQQQIEYFDPTLKQTMVPRDTPYLRRHIDELLTFGEVSPGERLLEVGCGMGRYTFLLLARGHNLEGLDLAPQLLDQLRIFDDGRYDVPLHCLDILDRPASLAGKFDVLIAMFTLHHLYDLEGSLEAMRHYLRPGGRIVFLEPNPYCPLFYLQMLITPGMTWKGDGGIVRMTRRRLSAAAQNAGFINFRLERFGILPPFLANRPFGPRLEGLIEALPGIRPFLAFQLIGAQAPE